MTAPRGNEFAIRRAYFRAQRRERERELRLSGKTAPDAYHFPENRGVWVPPAIERSPDDDPIDEAR